MDFPHPTTSGVFGFRLTFDFLFSAYFYRYFFNGQATIQDIYIYCICPGCFARQFRELSTRYYISSLSTSGSGPGCDDSDWPSAPPKHNLFCCRKTRKVYFMCPALSFSFSFTPNEPLFLPKSLCVCAFSSHPFWTSSSLDVPAGVTQEEGHTGFLIHLPSAVRALIFVARRIQPFLSLVDREVEFCVLTN